METKRHNWLSWITGSGKYIEDDFKEDLNLLKQFYQDMGYLDIVVDPEQVSLEYPKGKDMNVIISVEEGNQYSLGDFKVEGMTIFTETELMRVVELSSGEPFSPSRVDAAAQSLREYYTSRGYLESNVRAQRKSNLDTRAIDIIFKISESE